jgi:hypothetical protein
LTLPPSVQFSSLNSLENDGNETFVHVVYVDSVAASADSANTNEVGPQV